MRDPYWQENHHFATGWIVVMVVMMLALVVAVVALVLLVSRRSGLPGPASQPPAQPWPPAAVPPPGVAPSGTATIEGYDAAVRVLAERFALGQIDEAEFRARLAVLRG